METIALRKNGFFHKGDANAVLLIHGITGAPAEMQYVGRSLHKAGFTVLCNTLPRHCSSLDELKKVTWQEIAGACIEDFKSLKKEYRRVFVGGLSVGALMGIHLASRFPQEVSGLVALAPTVFYDGWALHKGRVLLEAVWHIPFLRKAIMIREGPPYGLKDEALRSIIARFYKHAKKNQFDEKVASFGSPFFPASCLYEHTRFVEVVKKELPRVETPILILHAREDDMVSLKNAQYILDRIGSKDKALVVLEDSYHMITIDQEKVKVAEEMVKFLKRMSAE